GSTYSDGDYHLALSVATPTADAAGDTLATAQVTNLTTAAPFSATARIGDGLYPIKDVDLYQVQVTAGQLLTAITSLPTGGAPINYITMRLFDSSGSQLAIIFSGSNSTSRIDYQFAAGGTYYVGLSGYPNTNYDPNVAGSGTPYFTPATGDYQLSLTLVTPVADAAGDSIATAQATNLGPSDGTFSATTKIGDGLYPLKDVDLYQFNPSAGQVITAQTSVLSGVTFFLPILRLFDSAGNQLAPSGSYAFQYQLRAAGTYYTGISGYPNYFYNPNVAGSGFSGSNGGDYQLNLTLATPTADAAGNTLATAQTTGLGPGNGAFGVTAHIGD